jgi:hypothetical protein
LDPIKVQIFGRKNKNKNNFFEGGRKKCVM